jgi:hypothetical protein
MVQYITSMSMGQNGEHMSYGLNTVLYLRTVMMLAIAEETAVLASGHS